MNHSTYRCVALALFLPLVAVFAMPGVSIAVVIFDDDFQDTTTGRLDAGLPGTTPADVLNAGVAVGTWSVAQDEESAIQSSGAARAIMMDQGSYNFTANFSQEVSLSNYAIVVTLDAGLRRRNNNQKRTFIEGLDANDNVLFRLRVNAPSNNNTNTALQYDNGPGYTDIAKPSLIWSSGYNPSNLRSLEILASSTSYNVWLDVNNDGIRDSGEFVTGLPYLNSPTAGVDRLVFRGNSQAGSRYDNILVTVIPEPATMLIWSFLAGLGIGLGWRRRTK